MAQISYKKEYNLESNRGKYTIVLSGSLDFISGYDEYRGEIKVKVNYLNPSLEIIFFPIIGHVKNEGQLDELFDRCKDNIVEIVNQDKFGEISLFDIKVD